MLNLKVMIKKYSNSIKTNVNKVSNKISTYTRKNRKHCKAQVPEIAIISSSRMCI